MTVGFGIVGCGMISNFHAKAIADLEEVVATAAAPENVMTAARNQLIRVRSRIERIKTRASR